MLHVVLCTGTRTGYDRVDLGHFSLLGADETMSNENETRLSVSCTCIRIQHKQWVMCLHMSATTPLPHNQTTRRIRHAEVEVTSYVTCYMLHVISHNVMYKLGCGQDSILWSLELGVKMCILTQIANKK